MALDTRMEEKKLKQGHKCASMCMCICVYVWAGVHVNPRVMWSDVWSRSPGFSVTDDEEDISSLPSRLLCVCVHLCACVYVWVFWTGQSRWWDTVLIWWHSRWQTVPPAPPFRPPGQTPASSHWPTTTLTHTMTHTNSDPPSARIYGTLNILAMVWKRTGRSKWGSKCWTNQWVCHSNKSTRQDSAFRN